MVEKYLRPNQQVTAYDRRILPLKFWVEEPAWCPVGVIRLISVKPTSRSIASAVEHLPESHICGN